MIWFWLQDRKIMALSIIISVFSLLRTKDICNMRGKLFYDIYIYLNMPQQNALVGRQGEKWLNVIVSVFIVFVWRQTTPWSYFLCVKAGSPWRIVGWKEKNFSICSGRLILESFENDTWPALSSQPKSYWNEREEFCHLYKAGSPWRIVRMTHDLHHLLNCNYIY